MFALSVCLPKIQFTIQFVSWEREVPCKKTFIVRMCLRLLYSGIVSDLKSALHEVASLNFASSGLLGYCKQVAILLDCCLSPCL